MKRFSIWNFYAWAYDVINKNVPYLKMLEEVIKEVQISGNLKILDAGCGTGNLLKKMSQVSFNSKFVGVDSSEQMLSRAKKKFLSNPSVTLHHTDLDKGLEFPDNSFDSIVSVNTLYAPNLTAY
jgi:ubiquinone/menaquinone biosynthesis C-methylase UbiE